MVLDPSLILAGQAPDVIGSLSRGIATGQQARQAQQQNALAGLYQAQGPQIMAGDPNALNALAGIDPMAAMNVQSNRLGMDAQRQSMAISQEEMAMRREQARRQAAEYAKGLTAEQAAQEAAALENGLKGAAVFFSRGDRAGYEAFLRQQQIDPAQFPFDQFEAHAATIGGVLDVLKAFQPEQPKFRQASPEEAAKYGAAGGQFGPDGRFYAINPPSKGVTQTITNPDGTTTTIQVGGTAGSKTGEATIGQTYNPSEVGNVLSMIDEIAQNPNLPRVIGPLEGGGGNNIDDLGMMARAYYGGEGTALIERIGQLQNNAWLSARDMLKGGGAITDYESRKAEGAVARLSRAKSEAEFKTALKDLRDAIVEGKAKLDARSGAPVSAAEAPGSGSQPLALSPAAQSVFEKYRTK